MLYKHLDTLISEKLDDSYFILGGETVHLLNDTASIIWESIDNMDESLAFTKVKEQLLKKGVAIDDAKLLNDLKRCINEMVSKGILLVVDANDLLVNNS